MNAPANQMQAIPDSAAASVESTAALVAKVAGDMALCIQRRVTTRQQAEGWVRKLRLAANLLEQRFLR